jgi:hypothetical protein
MAIDKITDNRLKKIETTLNGKLQDTIANACELTNITIQNVGQNLYNISATSLGGVVLDLSGKRFLLAGQTNKYENGIYIVVNNSPFQLARASDFITYTQINNSRVQIQEGLNAGNFYLCNSTEPFTIDITNLNIVDTDPALENFSSQISSLLDFKNNGTIDGGEY